MEVWFNPSESLIDDSVHKNNGFNILDLAWCPGYHDNVIRSFANQATEDIFNGRSSKAGRKLCPDQLWQAAGRKLDLLDSASQIRDLRVPPGNRLEALSGDRKGQYSIRINQQYRICFTWTVEGPEDVEIVDYH